MTSVLTLRTAIVRMILAALLVCTAVSVAHAKIIRVALDTTTTVDTLLVVDVADTLGSPGHQVPVSVFIQNLGDSLGAYQMLVESRNTDIMRFESDSTIDTCYNCLDSACTIIDTAICTLQIVPSTVVGTLSETWDFTQASPSGSQGGVVLLTGIADIDADEFPLPVLPFTNGVLVKVVGHIECNIPDTATVRTVEVAVFLAGTLFSTASGVSYPATYENFGGLSDTVVNGPDTTVTFDTLGIYKPTATYLNGSITVPFSLKGDLNNDGVYNVLDVVLLVNIAFKGAADPCPPDIGDINCDGVINVFDVVLLVNHVFKGGSAPGC